MDVKFGSTTPVSPSVFSVNGKTGAVTITLKDLGGKSEEEIARMIAKALKDKAGNNEVVHKSGEETIAGSKIFTDTTKFKKHVEFENGVSISGEWVCGKDDFDIVSQKNGSIFWRKDQVHVEELPIEQADGTTVTRKVLVLNDK